MNRNQYTRRQFIRTTAVLAGTALAAPSIVGNVLAAAPTAAAVKRTATDQVTLGNTGVKLSRLGIGTGVNSGHDQVISGKEAFIKLVRHAYDSGITYIDCAQRYETFPWIAEAIKGLPREKLFIQSKVPDKPEDVLATIDMHRKNFNTDYIDSLLIHCMTKEGWTDEWKRIMDGFNEAKEKKWIRAKGVSCHTLAALQNATESPWTEVHLVRVNPMGAHMDGPRYSGSGPRPSADIPGVLDHIKQMHAKGRGVIGMKIFGNGDFKDPAEREKSIRFAMGNKDIDAVVIGFEKPEQIDEAISRINRALAEV
jgi:hypothetical protein